MIEKVIVRPAQKDKFELYADFKCVLDSNAFIVKKGFVTDGANIPRAFWSIYPPNSPEYLSAVVLHDYLCENARLGGYTYKFADEMLKKALQELKVNKAKIFIFYYACRFFHKILRRVK